MLMKNLLNYPAVRRIFASLFALAFSFELFSQTVSIDYLLLASPNIISNYEVDKNFNSVRLNMPFSDDSIFNPGVIKNLQGKTILKIDLVYTIFKESEGFSQPTLNRNRLERLRKLKPDLFSNSAITWQVYAQNGCRDKESCKDFFHGIVIYYLKTPDKESLKAERDYFESTVERRILSYDTSYRRKTKITERYYQPILKSKQERGIKYENKSMWNRKEIVKKDTFYIPTVKPVYGYVASKAALRPPMKLYGFDTVVLSVFNRNIKWNDMEVVMDVTGSMSPYTTQVVAWIALNQNIKKVHSFTFFNDGDAKADNSKVIGSTGGIYVTKSNNSEEIVGSMRTSMSKGSGGDSPENNLEAILLAINNNPDCKEIILIADNLSNMRDISLISQIKKPVRVILCGSNYGVNAEYMKLARATGGSLHTMEEDLYDLFQLNEGETITVGKQKFAVKGGDFVLER